MRARDGDRWTGLGGEYDLDPIFGEVVYFEVVGGGLFRSCSVYLSAAVSWFFLPCPICPSFPSCVLFSPALPHLSIFLDMSYFSLPNLPILLSYSISTPRVALPPSPPPTPSAPLSPSSLPTTHPPLSPAPLLEIYLSRTLLSAFSSPIPRSSPSRTLSLFFISAFSPCISGPSLPLPCLLPHFQPTLLFQFCPALPCLLAHFFNLPVLSASIDLPYHPPSRSLPTTSGTHGPHPHHHAPHTRDPLSSLRSSLRNSLEVQ